MTLSVMDPAYTGPTLTAAPWTAEQVEHINEYQTAGVMHPFTCGRRDHHPGHPGVLVAERDGLHCPAPDCGYRQGWVHPFMADGSALRASPFSRTAMRALGRDRVRAAADVPRPCLLHEDIHAGHDLACLTARGRWLRARPHLTGRAARDAYALEVEQRILDRLIREHAPAGTRRINPALTK